MKELQFSIEIQAPKEVVWSTLWQDETFRQWASVIDPETYMVGELKRGNEVQFISAHGGYGVTSLVEEVRENEYLLLRHSADTQEEGKQERENQWTGGAEIYSLVEKDAVTTLQVAFDVPDELEAELSISYPEALRLLKDLAEK